MVHVDERDALQKRFRTDGADRCVKAFSANRLAVHIDVHYVLHGWRGGQRLFINARMSNYSTGNLLLSTKDPATVADPYAQQQIGSLACVLLMPIGLYSSLWVMVCGQQRWAGKASKAHLPMHSGQGIGSLPSCPQGVHPGVMQRGAPSVHLPISWPPSTPHIEDGHAVVAQLRLVLVIHKLCGGRVGQGGGDTKVRIGIRGMLTRKV